VEKGIISLIVRLLIATIFVVAGIAKLADLQGTRKGIREFGVPDWAASPLGILLPVAELAITALLIPVSTVLWGSLSSIALLLVFITVIGVNLAQGRKPSCNCFGQVHSEPVGGSTLVRNCVLLAGAAFVFWQGSNGVSVSVIGWMTGLSNPEIVGILLGASALILIAALGWLTFHLLRQNGRLLLRMDQLEVQHVSGGTASHATNVVAPSGLSIGTAAPAFELPLLSDGSTVSLDLLRAERRSIVLIFSDPECGPCSALLPEIARWEREYAATLTIALISRGSKEAHQATIGGNGLKYILLQKNREVAQAYRVNGTPGAVIIGRDGKIASFLAMGSQGIADLVAKGAGIQLPAASPSTNGNHKGAPVLPATTIELKIGQTAPPLKLGDLSGTIVDLASFRGADTLVLFWNPSCGFCAKMLPDLKRWEETRSEVAPQLFVVSSGTVDANRAMGLRAPVVLDQTFASGQVFRVRGTPAAVLVDAEGRIASGVATGAPAVFALANAHLRISA
jgi:peroxiredoxin